MSEDWKFQIRFKVPEAQADALRRHPDDPSVAAIQAALSRHDARALSQYDAFAEYVEQAERHGMQDDPLYKWTKATLDDPEKRRKHTMAFTIHVGGEPTYDAVVADALEADLRALAESGAVASVSRHDTNPANNLPIPSEYR